MAETFNVGTFVSRQIRQLLGSDPSRPSPTARAMLAQLRQASAAEPGTAPAVWALTLEGIPDLPERQRERVEQAAHVALTQFATHQQSRGRSMHEPTQPFGAAVRKLAQLTSENEPHLSAVYQRFTAMSMATSLPGLLAHSRGIIAQLRTHEIPFDYARYANDIELFLRPGRSRDVQRRWGRDFHRLPTQTTDPSQPIVTHEGEQS